MLTLAIDSGDGSDLRYDLAKEVVSIGASSSNDVVLRSPGVAPVHLVIRRTGKSLTFLGQPRQIVLLNARPAPNTVEGWLHTRVEHAYRGQAEQSPS